MAGFSKKGGGEAGRMEEEGHTEPAAGFVLTMHEALRVEAAKSLPSWVASFES